MGAEADQLGRADQSAADPLPQITVIGVVDEGAAWLHAARERRECRAQFAKRPVAVRVVPFHRGDDGHGWTQAQKHAVVFVGFDYEQRTLSVPAARKVRMTGSDDVPSLHA